MNLLIKFGSGMQCFDSGIVDIPVPAEISLFIPLLKGRQTWSKILKILMPRTCLNSSVCVFSSCACVFLRAWVGVHLLYLELKTRHLHLALSDGMFCSQGSTRNELNRVVEVRKATSPNLRPYGKNPELQQWKGFESFVLFSSIPEMSYP